MVYIHFPSNLTEEEHMLQAKYQKLKKKVINRTYKHMYSKITNLLNFRKKLYN